MNDITKSELFCCDMVILKFQTFLFKKGIKYMVTYLLGINIILARFYILIT